MRAGRPFLHRGRVLNRRNFLWELGGGLGGVALTALLAEADLLDRRIDGELARLIRRRLLLAARAGSMTITSRNTWPL